MEAKHRLRERSQITAPGVHISSSQSCPANRAKKGRHGPPWGEWKGENVVGGGSPIEHCPLMTSILAMAMAQSNTQPGSETRSPRSMGYGVLYILVVLCLYRSCSIIQYSSLILVVINHDYKHPRLSHFPDTLLQSIK
jgi:hypothetical protein